MQIRAARALLAWTQAELAERSGVAARSISDIEAGSRYPRDDTIDRLKSVFDGAGIELINKDGCIGVVKTLRTTL